MTTPWGSAVPGRASGRPRPLESRADHDFRAGHEQIRDAGTRPGSGGTPDPHGSDTPPSALPPTKLLQSLRQLPTPVLQVLAQ